MQKILNRMLQAHWLFVLIALIFGLVFIKITPPLWGLDEPSHFDRVYQITRGEIIPDRSKNDYGGNIPINLYNLGNYAIGDLVDNGSLGIFNRHEVDNESTYKLFDNQEFSTQMHNAPTSSSYSPVAYIGPIIGVLLARIVNANIGNTLSSARLFSLLTYVFVVCLALLSLKKSKAKWLIFIIALLPTAISQASVVTADNILIGLSLLFTALFIRLLLNKDEALTQKLFLALLGVGVLLPLIKFNYIFLTLAILLIPYDKYKSKNLSLIIKLAGVGVAILFGLLWSSIAKVGGQAPLTQRPDGISVVISTQITNLTHHPLHFMELALRTIIQGIDAYIQQATTLVGWNYVSIPMAFVILLSIAIVFAAFYAREEFIAFRKKLLLFTGLVILGVGSIFATFYVTFTPSTSTVIQGIQGRYFIPFLIPIALTLGVLIPVKVNINKKMEPYVFGASSVLCLVLTAALYYVVTY